MFGAPLNPKILEVWKDAAGFEDPRLAHAWYKALQANAQTKKATIAQLRFMREHIDAGDLRDVPRDWLPLIVATGRALALDRDAVAKLTAEAHRLVNVEQACATAFKRRRKPVPWETR